MTSVQPINNTKPNTFLTPKNTGYAAAAAMLLLTARAFTSSKPVVKTHKILGVVTGVLTLLHIGVVEYLHHKYKKM